MPVFRKIICAVDFSEASDGAVELAASMAAQTDAELHLVHAFQIPMLALPDGAVLPSAEWTAGASTKLQAGLERLAEPLRDRVAVTTHLLEGLPHLEIDALVDELGADLVVIGTHGRTGLSRLLMGSVAERIVRCSSVPVITVPSRQEG